MGNTNRSPSGVGHWVSSRQHSYAAGKAAVKKNPKDRSMMEQQHVIRFYKEFGPNADESAAAADKFYTNRVVNKALLAREKKIKAAKKSVKTRGMR